MNEIETNVLQNELKYKNTVILKYKIQYPVIKNSSYRLGRQIFNLTNRKKALELQLYCETQLYKEAKSTYEYNVEHGYPVMVYEVILNYQVTYNKENIVSLYQDDYRYTGGAHGITIRQSQNWNLAIAKQIPLEEFYLGNSYYLIQILQEINRQIQERLQKDPGIYFKNYCQLVLETFRLENYYLISNKIVIFFQQYDIAPYSTGIPTFEIIR